MPSFRKHQTNDKARAEGLPISSRRSCSGDYLKAEGVKL